MSPPKYNYSTTIWYFYKFLLKHHYFTVLFLHFALYYCSIASDNKKSTPVLTDTKNSYSTFHSHQEELL